MRHKIILYLLFVSQFRILFAQLPENIDIDKVIEEIASSTEENIDYSTLVEDLYYFYENPININQTSIEELERLQFLNDFQIKSLFDYLKNHGPLLTVYELNYMYGFNAVIVSQLLPFITVSTKEFSESHQRRLIQYKKRISLLVKTRLLLQDQDGFLSENDSIKPSFTGGKLYSKLRLNMNFNSKVLIGITMENDPGEELLKGFNRLGTDYYSGFLKLTNIGSWRKIIIGDYELEFGQGLTLWNSLSYGKSSLTVTNLKRGKGIKKHSACEENNYFRGIAGSYKLSNFIITPFFSYKNFDATLFDTLNDISDGFSSFRSSGLHRTLSEISNEKKVNEIAVGGHISYRSDFSEFGITTAYYRFSKPFQPSDDVYSQTKFYGHDLSSFGLDFRKLLKRSEIFGEISLSNKKPAYLIGLLFYPQDLYTFSLLYRHYNKEYFSHRIHPFAEYTSYNNERGLYLGSEMHPFKNIRVSAYFDAYKSFGFRYNTNGISTGNDYMFEVAYVPYYKEFKAYIRFKHEKKQKNALNTENVIDPLVWIYLSKLRLETEYNISTQLRLKNRIEFSKFKEEEINSDYGLLVFQDIRYEIKKIALTINLRYAYFFTESYDSRIYTYENNMPYSFSIPFFYGKGQRGYILIRYTPIKYYDIWLRYSLTNYFDRSTISSGYTEIEGNVKSEIEAQVRVRF